MRASLLILLAFGLAPISPAQTYVEAEDAGALFDVAADLSGGPYTRIEGTMAVSAGDVDLYRIAIADPAAFSATTLPGVAGGEDDTRLALFDAQGRGVYFNDDDPPGFLSTLPANSAHSPTAPGIYYLSVTHYDIGAFVAPGEPMFCEVDFDSFNCTFTDVWPPYDPEAVLSLWAHTRPSDPTTTVPGAAYAITLTGLGSITAAEGAPTPSARIELVGPNPVRSATAVEVWVDVPQRIRVALFDGLGRRVAELFRGDAVASRPVRAAIDAESLPAGTYMVRVLGESARGSRTLTVVR